jgi:hypothetical protein
MTGFHIGQKVVCVDDVPLPEGWDGDPLVRGVIYTITAIYYEYGSCGLLLREAVRSPRALQYWNSEAGYYARRFRPLEEKSDSIELFREIARGVSNGKPIIEDAEYRLPTPEKVRA